MASSYVVVLPPDTTEAMSSQFDVSDVTGPVKITIWSPNNSVMPRCKLPLYEKAANGEDDVWQPYYGEDTKKSERNPVFLTNLQRSFLITAPGLYRIHRSIEHSPVGASAVYSNPPDF